MNLAVNARDAMPIRRQAHHRDLQRHARRGVRPLPRAPAAGRLRHARHQRHRRRHGQRRPSRTSSSRSSPPRGRREPDSASRPSTASSSRAADTSGSTAKSARERRSRSTCRAWLRRARPAAQVADSDRVPQGRTRHRNHSAGRRRSQPALPRAPVPGKARLQGDRGRRRRGRHADCGGA